MKLVDHIRQSKGTLFSFEILPPLKGGSIDVLFDGIDPLMEFKPTFIDVTYHREEYLMRKRPDGTFNQISVRKRPGTVAICAAIMNKYNVEAVPHIICGGFTRDETENAMIDLNFLGIDNVLALRGDNQQNERTFTPETGGNENALKLVRQISDMNNGIYLDEELKNPNPTNFCIGVAAYPEKHIDAPNKQSDLNFLKRKVDSGAEFATTQMFFDNQKYHDFVDACRLADIHIPIIPGIKPITRKSQLYSLPKIFNIDIPQELCQVIEKAKSDAEVEEIGTEWCVAQCRDLMKKGAPVLHFYTMGYARITKKIVGQVF